ncbi:MAG TPA: lmo0937 family membrane protein [Chthonomonadaceae bacterium]|nr:lmo0937 family membrane protein [Chthonomonadaceae bacterium]
MANLLWTVIVILFVIWLLGLLLHVGGGIIHVLLVVALVLLVYNLATKGRATL